MKNLKVQLKLLTSRLGLVIQKKQAISRQQTAEIAQLLDQGKDASARIKVELVIREDYYVEGLQLIALQAELLLARFGLLDLKFGI
jgi:vacuolar protein sorting-associated protein IST1